MKSIFRRLFRLSYIGVIMSSVQVKAMQNTPLLDEFHLKKEECFKKINDQEIAARVKLAIDGPIGLCVMFDCPELYKIVQSMRNRDQITLSQGGMPLCRAIRLNNPELVKLLLYKGEKVLNRLSPVAQSPLFSIIQKADAELLAEVMRYDNDVTPEMVTCIATTIQGGGVRYAAHNALQIIKGERLGVSILLKMQESKGSFSLMDSVYGPISAFLGSHIGNLGRKPVYPVQLPVSIELYHASDQQPLVGLVPPVLTI